MARDSLAGYAHVADYPFRDADGRVLFVKRRYEALDPISGVRSKTFRYFNPETRELRKPSGADDYLYRLHEVLPAILDRKTIHWTEGEKDCDAVARIGRVATSHHQGAGHVTLAQAAWLRAARRVVIWVDRDKEHPEVGAYDACLRHNLLVEVGVSAEAISFVCARTGKDAFDHLAAGHTVARARRLDKEDVARVAQRFRRQTAHRIGYTRG